jgi:hypothetical protein
VQKRVRVIASEQARSVQRRLERVHTQEGALKARIRAEGLARLTGELQEEW